MSLDETQRAILDFIGTCREPTLIEPGVDPIPLLPGSYEILLDGARLTIQAWTRERNLLRRITGVKEQVTGRLTLAIEVFGKRTGEMQLLDVSRPQAKPATRRAGRASFRDVFARMIRRQFPGWRLAEVTTEPDLHHSLSPAYPRAFLTRGNAGWAAIAASPDCTDIDGILTFGLIWLSYLRQRERRTVVGGLAVFVPEGRERTTCLRIRCLDNNSARFDVFAFHDGAEQRMDINDAGNIDTRLAYRHGPVAVPAWLQGLEGAVAGVRRVDTSPTCVTWRVSGLPFVFFDGKEVRFGLETRHTASASNRGEIERLAAELARARSAEAPGGLLFSTSTELWLESQVRENICAIDAGLNCTPVYGQVPSFAAAERGVLDLLACSHDGRLAVVEVKAAEDLHLPLQALDYWMRVDWHAQRGEFASHGYFPGIPLRERAPKLLLVAPSLCFHPTTETVISHFHPDIEVDCVGVAMGWRSALKVVFRRTREDATI